MTSLWILIVLCPLISGLTDSDCTNPSLHESRLACFEALGSCANCYPSGCLQCSSQSSLNCGTGLSLISSQCQECILPEVGCAHCPDSLGPNLLANSDFETPSTSSTASLGQTGWYISPLGSATVARSTAPSGLQYLKTFSTIGQDISLNAYVEYKFALWAHVKTGSVTLTIDLAKVQIYPDSAWKLYAFVVPIVDTDITLTIKATGDALIDAVSLQEIRTPACSLCEGKYAVSAGGCVCDSQKFTEYLGECFDCDRWVAQEQIKAHFSETYLSVQFAFPVSVAPVTCEQLFPAETLSKFGPGYVCSFAAASLEVLLGENHSLTSEVVWLNQRVLKGQVRLCGFAPEPVSVTVAYLYPLPKPVPKMLAPGAVGLGCEDLYINARASEGRLNHQLQFRWTLTPSNGELGLYNTAFGSQSDLTIPREALAEGSLTVKLEAKNWLGVVSEAETAIEVSRGKAISIIIDQGAPRQFEASKAAVYSVGSISECGVHKTLGLAWSLTSVKGNSTAVDEAALWAAQKSQMVLVIPARIFEPQTEVVFSVETRGIPAKSSLKLKCTAAPPVILLDTSDGPFDVRRVLEIDAGGSYDPNRSRALSFRWTCLSGGQDCSGLIQNRTSSLMVVPGNSFPGGSAPVFTLAVQSSVRLVSMVGVSTESPKCVIGLYKDKSQPSTLSSQTWNRLQLFINSGEMYTYRWYMDSKAYDFTYGANAESVSLPEGTLAEGADYILCVDVSAGPLTYTYKYRFTVAVPPRFGDLLVTPGGLAHSDVFEMVARDWVDADGPLRYAFGYSLQGVDHYLSIKNLSSVYYARLPAADPLEVWTEVYDSKGAQTRKSRLVSVRSSPDFDAEGYVSLLQERVLDPTGSYFDLPFLLNDLMAFGSDGVIEGTLRLIDSVNEYDEQDVNAVISVIRNAVLSGAAAEDASELIEKLVGRCSVQSSNLEGFVSILSLCVNLTQEFVDKNNSVSEIVMESASTVVKSYGKEMLFGDRAVISLPTLSMVLQNSETQGLNGGRLHFQEGIYVDFPPDFSESVAGLFSQQRMLVSTVTLNPAADHVPYILDLVLYDYDTLVAPPISIPSNFTFTVPFKKSVPASVDACVFLNTTSLLWDTTGCELQSLTSNLVLCKCTHLTAFTAKEFTSAGSDSVDDSNIKQPYNKDNLGNANVDSLAGLYVSLSLLVLYVLGCAVVRRLDRKDAYFRVKVAQNEGIDKFSISSMDDINVLASKEEVTPEDRQTSLQVLTRMIVAEHLLISPFCHRSEELCRLDRLTLFTVEIYGKLFFLGCFYQYGGSAGGATSMVDAIAEYSLEDFWKMAYSILLMIPVLLGIPLLLVRKPRLHKCRRYTGLLLCWALIVAFAWNITGFVLAFPESEYWRWLASVLITLLVSIFLSDPLKIVGLSYLGHLAMGLMARIRAERVRPRVDLVSFEMCKLPKTLRSVALNSVRSGFSALQGFSPRSSRTVKLD